MIKYLAVIMLVAVVASAGVCDERMADWMSQQADRYVRTDVRVLTENGGRLDWATDGNIYFDRRLGNNLTAYDVWEMDGAESGGPIVETCLTCNNPTLAADAGLSRGQPVVNPDSTWMIFQAEHPNHAQTYADPYAVQPGKGVYNDLWAMHLYTGAVNLVHRVSDGKWFRPKGGTLHPQWSPDGKRVVWSDLQNLCIGSCGVMGDWQLRMAEFWVVETQPPMGMLLDHEVFNPVIQGPGHWYETHDWGPNSQLVLYTGDTLGQFEIFADVNYSTVEQLREGCEPIRLTETSGKNGETAEFDEHAHFTNNNDAISWLKWEVGIDKGELWMMNPDGTKKRQITFFNTPGSAEYELTGGNYAANVPSDHAWMPWPPAGKALMAVFVQVDFSFQTNEAGKNFIYLIEFDTE